MEVTYRSLRSDHEHTRELWLSWECHSDPFSDAYLPDEADARQLWGEWIATLDASNVDLTDVPILWGVRGEGTAEHAPFAVQHFEQHGERRDFLKYFSWPTDEDGNEIQWTRLPVEDKLWRADRADKGGFIQEVTGWKPSAFQPTVNIEVIGRAAGLIS